MDEDEGMGEDEGKGEGSGEDEGEDDLDAVVGPSFRVFELPEFGLEHFFELIRIHAYHVG